ncbi:MAG: acyl-CoA dehydrogenase family protein [Spirochaetales bacterium]|nr:acyl-CoA dehydrogenase family protein [Spirochaetales bacterium]
MDYFFTEEQKKWREKASHIAEQYLLPASIKSDEEQSFPAEIVEIFAKNDLFRVLVPEEYGGSGDTVLNLCLIVEALSRIDGGLALLLAVTGLATIPIASFGNEEQKKKYLPDIAAGKKLAAFALTEANAGSDVSAIKTRAEKKGDFYIINGSKQWISNGGIADVYTVFVNTDIERGARGLSALIVEKGTEGFEFGKKENKMGIRANPTRELIFTDVKVPVENLLGKEGMGFLIAMKTFDYSRPGVASQALGIAQGAFDLAAKNYVKMKKGKEEGDFQGMEFLLAEMATKIEAARCLIYQTARTIDSGAKNISEISSMSKLYASDLAMEITTDAIQLMGENGYIKENLVEKMFRDAKVTQIYEGTNQIQKEIIALKLLKKYLRA